MSAATTDHYRYFYRYSTLYRQVCTGKWEGRASVWLLRLLLLVAGAGQEGQMGTACEISSSEAVVSRTWVKRRLRSLGCT